MPFTRTPKAPHSTARLRVRLSTAALAADACACKAILLGHTASHLGKSEPILWQKFRPKPVCCDWSSDSQVPALSRKREVSTQQGPGMESTAIKQVPGKAGWQS